MWADAQVVLHDHAEGAECNPACHEVPKANPAVLAVKAMPIEEVREAIFRRRLEGDK